MARLDPNASTERTTVALAPDAPGAAERSSVRLADLPAPVVTLTAPVEGATLYAGAAESCSAIASSAMGTVTECNFEFGTTPILAAEGADAGGGVWTASYTPPLWHALVGASTVRARARNSLGRYGYSAPVNVTIGMTREEAVAFLLSLSPMYGWAAGDGTTRYVRVTGADVDRLEDQTAHNRDLVYAGYPDNRVQLATDADGEYGIRFGGGYDRLTGNFTGTWGRRTEFTRYVVWRINTVSTVYNIGSFSYLGGALGCCQYANMMGSAPNYGYFVRASIYGPAFNGSGAYAYSPDTNVHCYTVRFDGAGASNAERLRMFYDTSEKSLSFGVTTIPPSVKDGTEGTNLGNPPGQGVLADFKSEWAFSSAHDSATMAQVWKALRYVVANWTA